LKAYPPQRDADDRITLDEETSAGDEDQQAENLHDVSDWGDLTVADTPAATAQRFYARLRNELSIRGVDYDSLPRLTPEGSAPPCYKLGHFNYAGWLAQASLVGATVPYRYDMPAEPNYCYDCTRRFKAKAVAKGVCNFPKTRFEPVQIVISEEAGKEVEVSIVGVSRSLTEVIAAAQLSSLLPDDLTG
jgi:hypothetical protein